MSESLVFDMTGDSKGAEAAFKRLQKENERLNRELGKTAEESVKAQKKGMAMGQGIASSIGSAVASVFTLQTALRLVSAEWDNILRKQQKSASTTMTTADAKMSFNRNIGDVPQAERQWWDKTVMGIARRTGQKAANVYLAAGEASASQGTLNRNQLAANIEMGFRFSPDSREEAQAIAGGLGDLSSLTGSGNTMVNAAAMLAMGKQARVTSLRNINQNLVPGAIGAQGFGGTANESMALATTLTNLMKDTTGATSKTAAISIAGELDKVFGAAPSPADHIRKLQQNPAMLKQFMGKASIPLEAKIPFQQLATKGSDAAKLFEQNIGGFAPNAGAAEAMVNRFLGGIANDPIQRTAQLARQMEANVANQELADQRGATAGVINGQEVDGGTRLQNALQRANVGWAQQKASGMLFNAQVAGGKDPAMAAVDILQQRVNVLEGGGIRLGGKAMGGRNDPGNAELAKELRELIAYLKTEAAKPKKQKHNIDANTE